MPGLEQLKQFSEDVAKLGNELTIREERGEPLVQVPLPAGISEEDDSDDFALGMPLQDADGKAEPALGDDDLLSALGGGADYSALPELDSLLNPEPADDLDFSEFPELDALLNPSSQDNVSLDEPFQNEVSGDTMSGDIMSGDIMSGGVATGQEDSSAQPESMDMGLVDIDSDDSNETELDFGGEPVDSFGASDFGGDISDAGFDLPDFDSQSSVQSEDAPGGDFNIPDFGDMESTSTSETLGGGFDLPDFDNLDSSSSSDLEAGELDFGTGFGGTDDIEIDSEFSGDNNVLEQDFDVPDFGAGGDGEQSLSSEEPSSESAGAGFDIPDLDNMESSGSSESADAGFDIPDFDSLGSGQSDEASPSDFAPPPETAPLEDGIAFDTMSLDSDGAADSDFAAMPVSDDAVLAGDSEPQEEMDAFGSEQHEVFDAPDDPFEGAEPPPDENFDDFVIPGISDQAAGATMAKPKRMSLDGKDGKKEKHTLTDKEYETFLKNLKNYPLNLRIELQKLIVSDEFKDEVVFDLIQKVLKKTSARQLATQLEKLLDISIPVPREFERRTAAQYEEYKKSAEYQLKNRILPVAFISVMAACILYIVFLFGKNFVYEPLRANALYKEGYALLEEGAYPQSEIKFDEASLYQQQKRWFFKYADGYRAHKQYERARMIYRAGLQRFNQDKELGLDYAEMELYDLRNFENAEAVVRREVLDYHINDPDGMLLLGDIYLEWGDERDPAKYEEARQVYDDLLQIYGQQDLYLARMMRYYIRVDDLRDVLQMKEYFYPKKKALGGQDLIELSGYLLGKISGNIAPADEYLLPSIEDVRELLERAVEAAPDVPESLYNMGLYFVNSNNSTSARDWLSAALTAFEDVGYKPRKRLLRQLNTYRLLGDLDVESGEYISAEEKYRTGISLFEKSAEAGLVGDSNVGQLYAALGDINFLHSGDYDEALRNYSLATKTQYDVPSISYKMGYINYSNEDYGEALNLFIKTADREPTDSHVLLALGNTLSARGDNFAAHGYYQRLMDHLDRQMVRYEILLPHDNEDHEEFIRMYKRTANNLGVTLYRLARQTGNSTMNADALTNFTASLRAFDSLYRNPSTLVRQEGSNLAERNIKYMSMPVPEFEPSIYTEIEPFLEGEVIR